MVYCWPPSIIFGCYHNSGAVQLLAFPFCRFSEKKVLGMVREYRKGLWEEGKPTWFFPPNLPWNFSSIEKTELLEHWFFRWDKKQTSCPLSELYTFQQKQKAELQCLDKFLFGWQLWKFASTASVQTSLIPHPRLSHGETVHGLYHSCVSAAHQKKHRKTSEFIFYSVWYFYKGNPEYFWEKGSKIIKRWSKEKYRHLSWG